MRNHYSQPKGFVGRQLIYEIRVGNVRYGAIAAGSATRFLPGRCSVLGTDYDLNSVINNTFYHIIKPNDSKYPIRNFTSAIVAVWRERAANDWKERYGSDVIGFESLVELPRTGELYKRDGWLEVGLTKGYTCKRTAGKGTDCWTGRRVWDTTNLRPKRVFIRKV